MRTISIVGFVLFVILDRFLAAPEIAVVVPWCLVGVSIAVAQWRLGRIEGALQPPLAGMRSLLQGCSAPPRVEAIVAAIGGLKLRSEIAGAAFLERVVPVARVGSCPQSEEEVWRLADDALSDIGGVGGWAILTIDPEGRMVARGPIDDLPRFQSVSERLYRGYLRDGETITPGVRDSAFNRGVFGEFAELGFRYALVHPFRWKNGGIERRGLLWSGFSTEHPPFAEVIQALHRLADRIEEELRLLGAVADLSYRVEHAESLEARKSEFLAHLSHDIRSPLNNIKAVLSYLKPVDGDGEVGEMIDIAVRNSDALTELVEDLLDFTRLREGHLIARPERFDIQSVVREVVESFRVEASRRAIELLVKTAPEAVEVNIDRRQLRRVVTNLVGNAIKFTERGSVSVAIATTDAVAEIVVADTGIGMSAEETERLFTPFTRFGDRRFEGVGLGLSLSKVLIELNGGRIAVASMPRVGSEFRVSFPRVKSESFAPPRSLSSEEHGEHRDVSILLVDDDNDSCASLSRALSGYRVKTLTATSPAEAAKIIEVEDPDVVVSDVEMPLGGGEFLVELLSKIQSPPALFLLTGRDQLPAELTLRVAGVFRKPLDLELLVSRLQLERRPKPDLLLASSIASPVGWESGDYPSCSTSGASRARNDRIDGAARFEKIDVSPMSHDSTVPEERTPTRTRSPIVGSKTKAGPPESPRQVFASAPV